MRWTRSHAEISSPLGILSYSQTDVCVYRWVKYKQTCGSTYMWYAYTMHNGLFKCQAWQLVFKAKVCEHPHGYPGTALPTCIHSTPVTHPTRGGGKEMAELRWPHTGAKFISRMQMKKSGCGSLASLWLEALLLSVSLHSKIFKKFSLSSQGGRDHAS